MGKRRRHRFSAKDLTITIDGRTYRVFNINEHGLGFLVDSPAAIEIGGSLKPLVINAPVPVRITGIPRHVSLCQAAQKTPAFKPGWVCGLEFSTRRDPDGQKLLLQFLAEAFG
ncbi:MAG TPA: hypothetical protein VLT88_16945, partial [Desulfosarcina sp.]|nr:hypothetical protein [Desulfosarcina sp.]